MESAHSSQSVVVDLDAERQVNGLSLALRTAGFAIVRPGDSDAWAIARSDRPRSILVSVSSPSDVRRLAALAAVPGLTVLALVAEHSAASFGEVIFAGADGVVSRAASPTGIVAALTSAISGTISMPAGILRTLIAASDAPEPGVDRRLLRLLVAGHSAAEIGVLTGYSERQTFRHLRELYRRLGVASRAGVVARGKRRNPETTPGPRIGPVGCVHGR